MYMESLQVEFEERVYEKMREYFDPDHNILSPYVLTEAFDSPEWDKIMESKKGDSYHAFRRLEALLEKTAWSIAEHEVTK